MHYFLKASLHTSAGVGVHADRWAVTGVCAPDRGGRGQPVQNTPKGNAPFMSDGQNMGQEAFAFHLSTSAFPLGWSRRERFRSLFLMGEPWGFQGKFHHPRSCLHPSPTLGSSFRGSG